MNFNQYDDMSDQQENQDQQESSTAAQDIFAAQLAKCEVDVAMWKEQTSRIFADFENYKKRMEREQLSWMQTAQVTVLKDLLPMVDNFERALTLKTEATTDVYAGIEMIYKSLMQLLQKYGIAEFKNYTDFDPEMHEALMHVDAPDYTSGQIVQVLEKGFMIKDKVLRPAKVAVVK